MDKGTPVELFHAGHRAIFDQPLTDFPWWAAIEREFTRGTDGMVPAHWSYRITCGNPDGEGLQTREVAFGHVHNMVRTIAAGTWDRRLDREGTAPSDECRHACTQFLKDPAAAVFTPHEADEVIQMIIFGAVEVSMYRDHRTT